jgi:hypothetical protein
MIFPVGSRSMDSVPAVIWMVAIGSDAAAAFKRDKERIARDRGMPNAVRDFMVTDCVSISR